MFHFCYLLQNVLDDGILLKSSAWNGYSPFGLIRVYHENSILSLFDQERVYQEEINLYPFAQLRVQQEDINLCLFDQLQAYQENIYVHLLDYKFIRRT